VVYLGTVNGITYGLDASTGATLWSDKSAVLLPRPVVANGVVYDTVGNGGFRLQREVRSASGLCGDSRPRLSIRWSVLRQAAKRRKNAAPRASCRSR